METGRFPKNLSCDEPEAVERVIARLEPWLRRVIHVRLQGSRLRRVADTGDVFQSLMKDLISRAAGPQSNGVCSLRPYLLAAVQNKIRARLRKERRNAGSLKQYELLSAEPEPADIVATKEFVEAVRCRLCDEDRRLFEFRRQGSSWAEVAQAVGGRPDALRMRLRRSLAAAVLEVSR
jgi:DNA-directed RNA polymerase specialized sigma24 family protein